MTMGSPGVVANDERPPFREGLFTVGEGTGGVPRLIGSRCLSCGILSFPKRVTCARCGDTNEQEEALLGPLGHIYTFAVVRRAPEAFPTPYVIGYVDLDEGVRVFTQFVTHDADSLRLGMRVELALGDLGDATTATHSTYKFRPVDGGNS